MFPKGGQLSLRRSLNIPSTDTLSASLETGSLVNTISGSTEDAMDRVGDDVHELTDRLKSLLPDYYAVGLWGLWGYCEGEQNGKSFSECSKPSASFSFDLGQILRAQLGQADGMLSELAQPVLRGYPRFTLDRVRVPCRVRCHVCYSRRRVDTLPNGENSHPYIHDGKWRSQTLFQEPC
jgi:hypothetical protein